MNAGVVSLLWVLVGVVLLVAMIVKFKINSIIALILSAIFRLFGGFCGRDSGIGPAQRAKTTIWN